MERRSFEIRREELSACERNLLSQCLEDSWGYAIPNNYVLWINPTLEDKKAFDFFQPFSVVKIGEGEYGMCWILFNNRTNIRVLSHDEIQDACQNEIPVFVRYYDETLWKPAFIHQLLSNGEWLAKRTVESRVIHKVSEVGVYNVSN